MTLIGLLDAYYLALERLYRRLYDTVASEGDTVWGLGAGKATPTDVARAVGSPSVWLFYGAALV
jgi:hypothetical protein